MRIESIKMIYVSAQKLCFIPELFQLDTMLSHSLFCYQPTFLAHSKEDMEMSGNIKFCLV